MPRLELAFRARAIRHNLPHEFMAEDHIAFGIHIPAPAAALREGDEFFCEARRVQIRTANATGLGAHQHLAWLKLRVRHIAKQKTALAENRGAHGVSSPNCWPGIAPPLLQDGASATGKSTPIRRRWLAANRRW